MSREVKTEWDRLLTEVSRYNIHPAEWIGRWLGEEDLETVAREVVKESVDIGIDDPFEFLKIVVKARELPSYSSEEAIPRILEGKGFYSEEQRRWGLFNKTEEEQERIQREFKRDVENTIRKMKDKMTDKIKDMMRAVASEREEFVFRKIGPWRCRLEAGKSGDDFGLIYDGDNILLDYYSPQEKNSCTFEEILVSPAEKIRTIDCCKDEQGDSYLRLIGERCYLSYYPAMHYLEISNTRGMQP